METVEVGRRLAALHAERPAPEYRPERSLLNYAEAARQGDWTLRSALVRLAQPDPVRVGELLTSVRRLDATLHQATRALERNVVACDETIEGTGGAGEDRARVDVRVADLARLVAAGADASALLRGYEERDVLDEAERIALPLLEVAVRFEGLSHTLARWAEAGPSSPPLADVDDVRRWTWARMDELGVPVESGPPPGVRRGQGRTP